jgi:hypothetical protein
MEIRVEPSLPPVDLRWDVVRRVAQSASFQRSPRLRELLTYICERALQNRPQDLREQVIGCLVFGRKADYSPGDDNIVRVEVRQLRKRLEEYFGAEGKNDPFVILIPKGAYIPVFEPRDVQPSTPQPPRHDDVEAAPTIRPSRDWRRWAIGAATLALALAVCCLWLWTANQAVARTTAPSAIDRTALWQYLFNPQRGTNIVCADSSLVVAEALLSRTVTLDEYISRDYLKPADRSEDIQHALLAIPNWQFTDLADARLVQRLFRLNADHWDKAAIRSAKTMQIQDFTGGNAVLLGSNRSNPWNRLFEPMLNFRFDYDEAQRVAFIRNVNPLKDEQATYRAALPGKSGDCYSTIALVPNLRRTGNVLLIGGTTAEGTESAGEFIMNPASSSGLLSTLIQRNKGRLPYFEVLLRSGTFSGIAKNAEITAIRIIPVDPPRY